jgi:hypothetical protein
MFKLFMMHIDMWSRDFRVGVLFKMIWFAVDIMVSDYCGKWRGLYFVRNRR